MKKSKTKKKSTITILILLFILLTGIVFAGGFIYKNRNTMLAMYYLSVNKVEQLEQNKIETEQKAIDAIKEYGIEDVRPLTEEETNKLNSGELTEEEAVDIILGKDNKTPNQKDEGQGGISDSSNESKVPDDVAQKNEEIAQLIGKLYVMKAKFSQDLTAIEDWVNSEYRKYSKEYGSGKIPSSIKIKVGKAAYAKALDLESKCDAQVGEILERITVLLKETGQSTSIVKEIEASYENEKMVAKTYYMNQI